MSVCLSPNGQTHFALHRPPTDVLVGTVSGLVHLGCAAPGHPWGEQRRSLVGRHIGAVTTAPGDRLFAGCHAQGGLHRSLDNGTSWREVGQGITASDFFSLAILESTQGPAVLAGTEPASLFRSDDFGDSWRELKAIGSVPGAEKWTFPPPPHSAHVKAITINKAVPNSLFACVEQGALLRTDDGGLSWIELDSMWRPDDYVYHDAHRILVAPWNPKLLIFVSGIGIYRSEDAGLTWTPNPQIEQHTKYPDVLVASESDHAIFVGGPADYPVDWLGGNATGTISRSLDEGRSWQPAHEGLPKDGRANIEALSIASYPGGYTLFAGNTAGQIFSSENGAQVWKQIGQTAAISKGAHHKIAQLSVRLPKWAGDRAAMIFKKLVKISGKRAAKRRRAEFASRTEALAPTTKAVPPDSSGTNSDLKGDKTRPWW
jgi:photosystem II stability/assembly factor-like uncharacterized protein